MNYREKAIKRMVETYEELDDKAKAEVLDKIQFNGAIQAAQEIAQTKTVTFRDMYEIAEAGQVTMNSFEGFGSGLQYFDEVIMGFRPGEVTVIAGPPNFGKTMVALNLITATSANCVKRGLIISLEMTKEEISKRLYRITKDHQHILDNLIIQTSLKVTASNIEYIIKRERPDIVMIDMLQKLADRERGTEYERVSAAMSKVKDLALKLNIPIILVSHVSKSRSGRNGEATALDLKGASNIEQELDVGIMINKPNKQSTDIIATNFKHRTKHPFLFHVDCLVQTDGIRVLEEGKYEHYGMSQ